MAEKRKILKPVGKPSFSIKEAIKIIRELKEEQSREQRTARSKSRTK